MLTLQLSITKEVLLISIEPSNTPIFLHRYHPKTDNRTKHFHIRRSASTSEIKDVEDIITYVFNNNNYGAN